MGGGKIKKISKLRNFSIDTVLKFLNTERMKNFKTPGQYIQSLLEERKWSQKVLSVVLDIDESSINKIITGKKPIDAKLSLLLSDVFEVRPEIFLDLQKSYELAQARIISMENPKIALKAKLFGAFPIQEMIKRGWIDADNIKDTAHIELELKRFLKVDDIKNIPCLSYAAKKTDEAIPLTSLQYAWIARVRELSQEMIVGKYSKKSAERAISQLAELRTSIEAIRKVSRILAESGIRFLIVEALKGSKIDGVCLWLDENSPVVALSTRFDRIDNFWFVLRHELEHVLCGHGKISAKIDEELESSQHDVPDEEIIANQAASEFCVPRKSLENFISRKAPFFYDRDVVAFAKTINVHPGLVAGQLRYKLNLYNRFSTYLVKVRSIVSTGATIDGWGNIVPVQKY